MIRWQIITNCLTRFIEFTNSNRDEALMMWHMIDSTVKVCSMYFRTAFWIVVRSFHSSVQGLTIVSTEIGHLGLIEYNSRCSLFVLVLMTTYLPKGEYIPLNTLFQSGEASMTFISLKNLEIPREIVPYQERLPGNRFQRDHWKLCFPAVYFLLHNGQTFHCYFDQSMDSFMPETPAPDWLVQKALCVFIAQRV